GAAVSEGASSGPATDAASTGRAGDAIASRASVDDSATEADDASVVTGTESICSHGMSPVLSTKESGTASTAVGSIATSAVAGWGATCNTCPVTVSNMAANRKATGLPGASERMRAKSSLGRFGFSASGSSSKTSTALPYSAT